MTSVSLLFGSGCPLPQIPCYPAFFLSLSDVGMDTSEAWCSLGDGTPVTIFLKGAIQISQVPKISLCIHAMLYDHGSRTCLTVFRHILAAFRVTVFRRLNYYLIPLFEALSHCLNTRLPDTLLLSSRNHPSGSLPSCLRALDGQDLHLLEIDDKFQRVWSLIPMSSAYKKVTLQMALSSWRTRLMVGRRAGLRSDYLSGYNLITLRALTFEHCQDPYALYHVLWAGAELSRDAPTFQA